MNIENKLKLIKDPNNVVLKSRSLELDEYTPATKDLIMDMAKLMQKEKGVGLAAVQVGIPIRLFVMCDRLGNVISCCNPKIIKAEKKVTSYKEGCLSVPGKRVNVKRYKRITVEFINWEGEKSVQELRNQEAFVFQHELDHLDGITLLNK